MRSQRAVQVLCNQCRCALKQVGASTSRLINGSLASATTTPCVHPAVNPLSSCIAC